MSEILLVLHADVVFGEGHPREVDRWLAAVVEQAGGYREASEGRDVALADHVARLSQLRAAVEGFGDRVRIAFLSEGTKGSDRRVALTRFAMSTGGADNWGSVIVRDEWGADAAADAVAHIQVALAEWGGPFDEIVVVGRWSRGFGANMQRTLAYRADAFSTVVCVDRELGLLERDILAVAAVVAPRGIDTARLSLNDLDEPLI